METLKALDEQRRAHFAAARPHDPELQRHPHAAVTEAPHHEHDQRQDRVWPVSGSAAMDSAMRTVSVIRTALGFLAALLRRRSCPPRPPRRTGGGRC